MLAAKKISKKNALKKKNPRKQNIQIIIGNDTKVILFSLINLKFELLKKNGQVAPKWVSAKNKIVKKIKKVSNWGNKYNIIPYITGKIKGNLTKLNSKLNKLLIIFFSNYNK